MEAINALRSAGSSKKQVVVFKGMKDLQVTSDEAYDTLDKKASTYLEIPPSYGQQGGGEYCYNFWIYVNRGNVGNSLLYSASYAGNTNNVYNTDGGFEDSIKGTVQNGDAKIILFLKGSTKLYAYKSLCYNSSMPNKTYKTDILVKSPLVKLEHNLDVLTVEFNLLSSPEATMEKSTNTCNDINTNWETMNAYRVSLKNISKYDQQWMMVTVCLQDTYPSDPLAIRNKVRCTIYVNGTQELDKYIDGKLNNVSNIGPTLKQNNGNLFINPQTITKANNNMKLYSQTNAGNTSLFTDTTSQLSNVVEQPANANSIVMADLTYLNYIPDASEVSAMFNNGFNKTWAPSISQQTGANQPLDYLDKKPAHNETSVLSTLKIT